MTVTIRPATPADAGIVFDFVMKLADYEKLADEVDASEAMIADALFRPDPKAFCDLAFADGEPAGFALWFYNFSTFRGRHGIYLEDLFVEPRLRGLGIGRALLQRLAARCVEEGLARFEWSVLDWNEPSIAFYRSLGAVAKDEWTMYQVSGEALARLGAGGAP